MQLQEQPVWVENGESTAYLLWEATLTGITGTFVLGETLAFTSGATGVVVAWSSPTLTFYVDSVQQPVALDVVASSGTGDGTVSAFGLAPDLAGAGVDGEEFFVRDGDGVPYIVSSVPTNSSVTLSGAYAGVSSAADEATCTIHLTRTPFFGLPSFDRRDRALQILLSELSRLVDAALQDHEERIVALEP
jgi:hypothetical protein